MTNAKLSYEPAKCSNTGTPACNSEVTMALWDPIQKLAEFRNSIRSLSLLKELDDLDDFD